LQLSRKRKKSCFGERFNPEIGTTYGGVLTLFAFFICTSYFYIQINGMYSGKHDIIKTEIDTVTKAA